jgi:hypothetical protein
MSTTVDEVCEALAGRLATISGLRAHAVWPDSLNAPAAIVDATGEDWHQSLGDYSMLRLDVLLVVAPATSGGLARGLDKLAPYLARTGTQSVKAAIEGDRTLGGLVASVMAIGWRDKGVLDIGGAEYIGARIGVEVNY